MMKIIFLTILSVLPLVLNSCAGYRLGGAKPPSLAAVKKIAVVTFSNDTLQPRAESLATSAVIDALVREGTYQIVDQSLADAILEGSVTQITYSELRGSRFDALVAEELNNTVQINWTLRDAQNPTKVIASGENAASSNFFVDSNLQTARDNALPDAFERAAVGVASKLGTGY